MSSFLLFWKGCPHPLRVKNIPALTLFRPVNSDWFIKYPSINVIEELPELLETEVHMPSKDIVTLETERLILKYSLVEAMV